MGSQGLGSAVWDSFFLLSVKSAVPMNETEECQWYGVFLYEKLWVGLLGDGNGL